MAEEDNICVEFKQSCSCSNLNDNQMHICYSHTLHKRKHDETLDPLGEDNKLLMYNTSEKVTVFETVYFQRFIHILYAISAVLIIICLSREFLF